MAARALSEWHRAHGRCPREGTVFAQRGHCLCPRALSHCDRAPRNAIEPASHALVFEVTDALSTLERLACVEHEWSTGKSRGEGGVHVGPWSCESTWRLTPPRSGVSQVRDCMLGGRGSSYSHSANLPKTASPVPMSGFSSAPWRWRDDDNARSTAAHTSAAAAAALHRLCIVLEVTAGP